MKVKVIKSFRDKKTKEVYKKGDEITLTDARYKEVKKAGNFVEEIKETKKADKAEQGAQ